MHYQALQRRTNRHKADAIEATGAGMSGGRGLVDILRKLRGK